MRKTKGRTTKQRVNVHQGGIRNQVRVYKQRRDQLPLF